jgi:carbon starvation protein
MTAGWQKLFHENPAIGFLAHKDKFKAAYDKGEVLAPAANLAEMKRVIINDYVDAALCAIFMIVVITVLISAIRLWIKVLKNQKIDLHESPYVSRS